jgi:hypothetical protein
MYFSGSTLNARNSTTILATASSATLVVGDRGGSARGGGGWSGVQVCPHTHELPSVSSGHAGVSNGVGWAVHQAGVSRVVSSGGGGGVVFEQTAMNQSTQRVKHQPGHQRRQQRGEVELADGARLPVREGAPHKREGGGGAGQRPPLPPRAHTPEQRGHVGAHRGERTSAQGGAPAIQRPEARRGVCRRGGGTWLPHAGRALGVTT